MSQLWSNGVRMLIFSILWYARVYLAESVRVNDDYNNKTHHDTAFIDSAVQEKNVTYPTDAKLHKKIVVRFSKFLKI